MKITQNVRDYAAGLEFNKPQLGQDITPDTGELSDTSHAIKQVDTELVGQVGEASADEVRLGMEQMKQKFIEEGKQLYKEV